MFTLYDGSNTQQKNPEVEEHKISVANDIAEGHKQKIILQSQHNTCKGTMSVLIIFTITTRAQRCLAFHLEPHFIHRP
jgi:RNase P subunit RPR2